MSSTDYLKTLISSMDEDNREAEAIARELVRDDVLLEQTLTRLIQIKQDLMWTRHDIERAERTEAREARRKEWDELNGAPKQ